MPETSDRRLLAAFVLALWLHVGAFGLAQDWTARAQRPLPRSEPLRVELVQAPAPAPPPPAVSAPPPPPPPMRRGHREPAEPPLRPAPPTPPSEPPPVVETRTAAAKTPAAPEPAPTAFPAAPGDAPQAASPDVEDSYVARVGRMIEAQRRYPHAARRRRLEGVVVIRLAIAHDGRVRDARAVGNAPRIFERASLAAVADAAPFPRPPAGFDEMEIAIHYELDR